MYMYTTNIVMTRFFLFLSYFFSFKRDSSRPPSSPRRSLLVCPPPLSTFVCVIYISFFFLRLLCSPRVGGCISYLWTFIIQRPLNYTQPEPSLFDFFLPSSSSLSRKTTVEFLRNAYSLRLFDDESMNDNAISGVLETEAILLF